MVRKDGVWRDGERGWVILCPQDWPAGVDLYSIKSDNQVSVKGIVLSCATENLIQVQIHPGLDIQNLSSIIYHREFVIEINLVLCLAGLWRVVLLLIFQSGLIAG